MANLLLNPGFETGTSGNPDNWWFFTWSGTPTITYPETGRSGGSSVAASGGSTSDHGAYGQNVNIASSKTYTLSGYMKTENISPKSSANGALIGIDWYDSTGVWINYTETAIATGTTNWTLYTKTLVPGTDIPSNAVRGNVLLELDLCSGKVWYDDISFSEGSGTNGPCGQPTCYKCSGTSCVPDDTNGTFVSSNCDNTCTTVQGYNCTNCNTPVSGGTYTSTSACQTACATQGYNCTNCNTPVAGGAYNSTQACQTACTSGGPGWLDRSTCLSPTLCISNKYIAAGAGIIVIVLLVK